MASYLRTLVSGAKARYRDKDLDVDLDLAYITDRVIVMGYPAYGIEGIYRNNRDEVKRFLEHKHGKAFWVFNLCPVRENSYLASFFDNRVSRYPFPDHHAPPLAILPLIAREMEVWLRGSPDRVAVIHCKAGKGRSGTVACSYLLSKEFAASPITNQRLGSAEARDIATERADELMDVMPADEDTQRASGAQESSTPGNGSSATLHSEATTSNVLGSPRINDTPQSATSISNPVSPTSGTRTPVDSTHPAPLQNVLDLHTSKRMQALEAKQSSKNNEKGVQKKGVSIPSQRRWLLYWSLLLAGAGPLGFWGLRSSPPTNLKAKIVSIRVRHKEPQGAMPIIVRAVNTLMDQGGLGNRHAPRNKTSEVWVSIAKYNDKLVETLESWEQQTRDVDGTLGVRKSGSEHMNGEALVDMFKSDRWDKEKMVKNFARLGAVNQPTVAEETDSQLGKLYVHNLTPLSHGNWQTLRGQIASADLAPSTPALSTKPPSEAASYEDVTRTSLGGDEVIVDPYRELRGKLYMGKILFGWFWFIPAFHMTEPPSSPDAFGPSTRTTLKLGRKEVDFPLGIGEALVDVEVVLEWHRDMNL